MNIRILIIALFVILSFIPYPSSLIHSSIHSSPQIHIVLEVADNDAKRGWGLMGRTHLSDEQGMLFEDPKGSMWMFNVPMDLSVAFIDERGNIISIEELKAYPEKMDPKRPILRLEDMRKYPPGDRIYQFFLNHAVKVPTSTRFALEMNGGWFKRKQISPGDKFLWKKGSSQGFIQKL